jgi:hypothetical protein
MTYLVVIDSARFLHNGGEDGRSDEQAKCAKYAEERCCSKRKIVLEDAAA